MTVTREPTVIGAGFLSERGMVPILAGHRRRSTPMVEPALIDGCLFTGDSEMAGDGQIAAVGVRQSCVDAGLTDAACWGAVWVAHRVGV